MNMFFLFFEICIPIFFYERYKKREKLPTMVIFAILLILLIVLLIVWIVQVSGTPDSSHLIFTYANVVSDREALGAAAHVVVKMLYKSNVKEADRPTQTAIEAFLVSEILPVSADYPDTLSLYELTVAMADATYDKYKAHAHGVSIQFQYESSPNVNWVASKGYVEPLEYEF